MRRLRAHPAQPAPCLRGQHHILGGQDWLRVTVLRSLQDVTPYMNPAPFTVSPNTHVSQVFTLFRTMGLRHLPVVNAVGEVSGACEAVPPGGEPLSSAIDGAAAPRRGAPQTQPALRCPSRSEGQRAGRERSSFRNFPFGLLGVSYMRSPVWLAGGASVPLVFLSVEQQSLGLELPWGSVVKDPSANAGNSSSVPELDRSPGEGNGNPLQYSCLENSMDRGAWQAIAHGLTKESDTA